MSAADGLRKLQTAILESERLTRTPDCPDASRWISVYGTGERKSAWTADESIHISSCDVCLNNKAAYETVLSPRKPWWEKLFRSRRVRLVAMIVLSAVVPAVLVYVFAQSRTDYAESLSYWTSSLYQEIANAGSIVGALTGVVWFTARRNGWLVAPTLSLCLAATSVTGATLYTQDRVTQYASDELIHREELFQSTRWVLFDSVFFWPADPAAVEATGHAGQQPTPGQIRLELQTLSDAGFTGVYLFGDPGNNVAKIADELGLAVIQGITVHDPRNLNDPQTQQEIRAAIDVSENVDAYVLGHLRSRDVDMIGLQNELGRIRRATGKPVTPNFLLTDYAHARGNRLLRLADFVITDLPRPYDHVPPHGDPDVAAAAVARAVSELSEFDLPAIVSLVGYPSHGGPGFTEQHQKTFIERVLAIETPRGVGIAYTNGFDLPWKQKLSETTLSTPECDAHLGFFRTLLIDDETSADFEPKPALEAFRKDDHQ
ncbi:MAG: hypothetical protein R3C59_23625 [Planctomycetaceae bacterium]